MTTAREHASVWLCVRNRSVVSVNTNYSQRKRWKGAYTLKRYKSGVQKLVYTYLTIFLRFFFLRRRIVLEIVVAQRLGVLKLYTPAEKTFGPRVRALYNKTSFLRHRARVILNKNLLKDGPVWLIAPSGERLPSYPPDHSSEVTATRRPLPLARIQIVLYTYTHAIILIHILIL